MRRVVRVRVSWFPLVALGKSQERSCHILLKVGFAFGFVFQVGTPRTVGTMPVMFAIAPAHAVLTNWLSASLAVAHSSPLAWLLMRLPPAETPVPVARIVPPRQSRRIVAQRLPCAES